MPNETPQKMLIVALLLCLVCSVLVSSAAVFLKPLQERNKELDMKKNILASADLLKEGADVEQLFQSVEPRVVEFATGEYADSIDPATFEQRAAAKNPQTSTAIPHTQDIARIGRRAKYGLVYLVRNERGGLKYIILPVHGKGLWSTMYGFIALQDDGNTVAGITFYQQGETAGLGAEVSNPKWNAKWREKQVYGEEGQPTIQVIKGTVEPTAPNAEHKVDGIAGATLTSRGVTNLVRYWLGSHGYGPYLSRIREGELNDLNVEGG
ncbi:MAG: Na(+)-translocating NADH-quinone reductase subunit C [Gammaproteobacteria bacterium]